MTPGVDVGNVLQRVFGIYRDQLGLLIPAALVVFIPVAIINGLLRSWGGILALILTFFVAQAGTFLFQGMVVEAARDILDGRRDQDIGGLVGAAGPRLGSLVGAGLLAAIPITIGLFFFIAPGLYLLTIWAVIIPFIVLEGSPMLESFGRSQRLVNGYGWPVCGVIVCIWAITVVVGLLLSVLFLAISTSFAGYALSELVRETLIAPLAALASAVLYFELKRVRGEPVPGQEAATIPQAGAPQATMPPQQ